MSVEEALKSRSKLGYLPENAPMYSDMSVFGFLSFCAELRGLFGSAKNKAIDRAVQLCFLQPVLFQSVDTLSKGYRHRTCLAQAIIHDPEVLILDEPTDGLDPNQKHEVRTLIREMGRTKRSFFRRISSKKWKPHAPGRSLSIEGKLSQTVHRTS